MPRTPPPTAPTPPRPTLALRVGVTGARTLDNGQEARLYREVTNLLHAVRQEVAALAATQAARSAYAKRHGKVPVTLRFVSPLAEGADRLAARAAHHAGYDLMVPMPFVQDEYEMDFKTKESIEEFRMMLSWAGENRVELDGGRDVPAQGVYDEGRSYEAVGRFVVRNCDLLIAIWDGKPPQGRGGTFEIVRFAAETGTPVWWIHTETANEPIWLYDTVEPRANPDALPAMAELHTYLQHLIRPPSFGQAHHPHSLIERLVHAVRPTRPEPHLAYLREAECGEIRLLRAHAGLLHIAAGWRPRSYGPGKPKRRDLVSAAWHQHYVAADNRSYALGQRFRSVYVWVFVLIALSLVSATASLGFPANDRVQAIAEPAEALALALILLLLVVNIWCDWHQRWIDYRLLAELCRKQQALAPLGWSLPGRAVARLAEEAVDAGAEPDRAAWVAWLFAACIRASPLPRGRFVRTRTSEARWVVLKDLVVDQLRYHKGRFRQYTRAGRNLVMFGELLFLVVAILVAWKLWPLLSGHAMPDTRRLWLSLGTTVLPTLAAAVVGIRAYAELQLLADQSRHMRDVMRTAAERLGRLDPSLPLASQELGAITHGVAITMLQEVDGWARMFRVKVVEAG